MKTHKMFCIDSELLEDLGKINASSLINDLLTDYFNKNHHITEEKIIINKINENNEQISTLKVANEDLKLKLSIIKKNKADEDKLFKDFKVQTEMLRKYDKMTFETFKDNNKQIPTAKLRLIYDKIRK